MPQELKGQRAEHSEVQSEAREKIRKIWKGFQGTLLKCVCVCVYICACLPSEILNNTFSSDCLFILYSSILENFYLVYAIFIIKHSRKNTKS